MSSDRTHYRGVGYFVGIASICISILPWLGLGPFAFVIPGWGIRLPRIDLIDDTYNLYELVGMPLRFVAMIPPLDDFVYFAGEGVVRIRPFVVFLFYFLVGTFLIWLSVRQSKRAFTRDESSQ